MLIRYCYSILLFVLFVWLGGFMPPPVSASPIQIDNLPLFLGGNGTPLSLLIMGRDHKLYYEAYNDASDINQDGEIDVGYKPNLMQDGQPLDYYGYFDSHKCYSYSNGVFTPVSATTDTNTEKKTCPGNSAEWSGDFLNYLTTSRIDALRRVLYGGYRSTDTATETVLERAEIPQDAHSWGKEYKSTTDDGYDITKYTPLSQPETGSRHLFANTTILDDDTDDPPLLRVLTNSTFRIWEWVSIERPVAGTQCATGNNSRTNCEQTGGVDTSHPNNHSEFEALVARFGNASHLQGSGPATQINCNSACNPNGDDNNYLTIFTGTLTITNPGDYEFAVNGDDALEVIIDGQLVAQWPGGHGKCGDSIATCAETDNGNRKGTINLTAGNHTVIFHHEEVSGGDSYYLYWNGPDSLDAWEIVPTTKFSDLVISTYNKSITSSTMTDYTVRVKACIPGTNNELLEKECKGYPESNPTVYKPTGLLHDYGETDRMAFGLLTGSFAKHMSGGILRKNIATFKDEVDTDTGQFIVPTTGSIVKTINNIKVVGFGDYNGGYAYGDGGCKVPMVTPMQEGRCAMWGNPIAEMMYEGLRYFAGKSSPTSVYDYTSAFNFGGYNEADKLPKPDWLNPYRTTTGGYPRCSKPFQVVISDIPSFDTDQLPGVDPAFGTGITSDLTGINVKSLAQQIWNGEVAQSQETVGKKFIGESRSDTTNPKDDAPTPKTVDSFGNIRGLSPEEPTRQGGYYAGSVAFYGKTNDLNPALGNQKTDTYSVALSSPLPTIEIAMDNAQKITIVPFAKSVNGGGVGTYKPTNTIVDFYVDTIANTSADNSDPGINGGLPYIKFRINYEDSEYGSDHDMDAIVLYEFKKNANNTLTINLNSDYQAGGVVHHMGYVISGTTTDGVYLEVRDSEPNAGNDIDYELDTPPSFNHLVQGAPPAPTCAPAADGCWNDGKPLELTASRTFTPGTTASATFIKHDPLWYAAKWGGFTEDANITNDLPDKKSEWDAVPSPSGDGIPDNYFLVTNAGKLKQQLSKVFERIASQPSSAAAVAINTGSLTAGSRVYQAKFHSDDWSGHLLAYSLNANGSLNALEWDGAKQLNTQVTGLGFNTNRKILTYRLATGTGTDTVNKGIAFAWPSSPATPTTSELTTGQIDALKGTNDDATGEARLEYLRGSKANEGTQGLNFRARIETDELTKDRVPFVLGDIVNSNPIYVGSPQLRFDSTLRGAGTANESTSYALFRSTYSTRAPMVYVGANDGMLHGFATADGAEKIAYVPNLVFANLAKLTEPGYNAQHLFFVDAPPTFGDVFWDNGDGTFNQLDWRTILVGSLRKGGTGLFALDITDPTNFAESNAANLVLWEFTDTDLGYTFSQPTLGRLNNGSWAAVFGNGYNNTVSGGNGHAILYLIDVKTGGDISATPPGFKVKLDTNPTSIASLGSTTTPNGLSTPLTIDFNSDGIIDYAYAGDLLGNLWRFDLTNSNPDLWTFNLLFAADDGASPTPKAQPITSKPRAVRHPNGGLVILFGTGRYLGTSDVTTTDKQTFYGIWDPDPSATPPTITRANLQQQTITTLPINGQTFRISTATDVCWAGDTCTDSGGNTVTGTSRGWYVDLPGLTLQPAERSVSDSIIVGSNVVFTSIAPSDDPCKFGGSSWLNVLDATTGKRASESFVSLSGGTNGQPITATPIKATVNGESVAPTSLQQDVITSAPTKMDSPFAINIYTTDSEGKVKVSHLSSAGLTGRLSWRQLELEQ